MVDTQSACEGAQAAYDAACVMRLVAEKQARRTIAELTKGDQKDG